MTKAKLVAKTAVARCPRCFKPILARSPIEQFKTTGSGVAVYAHVGCKPFDLESATKQQMPKLDDDDYQISANSFTVTNGSQSQPLGDTGSEVPFGGSGGDSGNNGNGAGGSGQSGNGNGSGGAGGSGQQAGAMQSQTAPSPNSEAFRRAVESAAAQAAAQAEKNLQPKLQGMLVAAAQSALPVMEKKIRNELTGAAADKVQEMMQFAKEEIAKAVSEMALQIAEEVEKKREHIVKHVHVIKKEEIETILDENEVYHKCFHEVLELLSAGFNVFLPGPTGCISGDAWLRYIVRKNGKLVNKKGGRFDTLFRRFHNLDAKPGKPKGTDGCDYFIQSVNDEGRVFLNRIVDVVDSGIKKVYLVTTETGKKIKATGDHPFMTERGYSALSSLTSGDKIFTVPRVAQKTGRQKQPYRKEYFVKYHPNAAMKVVSDCVYYRIREYRAVVEADKNRMSLSEYITFLNTRNKADIEKLWFIPEGFDVHHIDENFKNNALSNLSLMESSKHDALHSTGVKIFAEEEVIVSIEPLGKEQVYDLVVADPFRNFVVQDFVVHNCGKTHMSQQVAKALGKRFGMINGSAGTTESELFGTSYPNIATGESHFETTDFLECYENGGLFLLDEGDAMDPNCLLKLNSAIANGFCVVPKRRENRKAVRHKDFSFIMAANTWGTGATRQYCGRNKLDAATLDRFIGGTVPMDYDANVEKRYACPDPTLYAILVGWRQKIIANRFQRILSTRFMRDAYKLSTALNKDITYIAQKLAGGWTSKECVAVFGEDYSTQL